MLFWLVTFVLNVTCVSPKKNIHVFICCVCPTVTV